MRIGSGVWLAAVCLVGGLIGCGPARVLVVERGRATEYDKGLLAAETQPIDLVACLVPDTYSSLKSGRRYAVAMARGALAEGTFTDVRENFEGLETSCDLKLVVNTMNAKYLSVFAARSGRRLFDLQASISGFNSGMMRAALYQRFAGAPELVARIKAERSLASSGPVVRVAPAERTAEVVPASGTAFVSDIEIPSYRLSERAQDFGVVIGIEKYQDLPEARFAERDAQAVKSHILALGVPERNIVYLAGQRALRSSLEKYVEQWLPNLVGQDSQVYFYFSGHGAPDAKTGDSYLVTWDGDPNFLGTTAYSVKRLFDRLAQLKARRVLVAMDACFSGAGGRSVLPSGARPLITRIEGLKPSGIVSVLAAAAPNEITGTVDSAGHGAFTYYLLRGLNGAAAEKSGRVTLRAVFDYLKPLVQDEARRVNRDQSPQIFATDDLLLR